MKLSVIGSRTFENYEMLENEILKLNLNVSTPYFRQFYLEHNHF